MPLILCAAAVVGIVWGGVYLKHGSLLGAILFYLLLNSAFGAYFWQQRIGPLPLTLDRLALLGVLAVFVVRWYRGEIDTLARPVDRNARANERPGGVPSSGWRAFEAPIAMCKPLGSDDWVLAAFLALLVFSTFTHDYSSSSADNISPVWRLISGYLTPAVVYVIGRQMHFGRAQSRQLLAAFTLFGVYLAITALLEIAGAWSLVFPRTIADPSLGLHFGRARGPMLHSVGFGFYLDICLIAAWLWLARLGRVGAVGLVCLTPLFLLGIYFSYTRSVWIGAALAMALVLGCRLRGAWRNIVLGGGICAAAAVGILYWDKFMAFEREYSAAGTRESAHLRESFAYVSWRMFVDHPLLGCGFGQFYIEKLPYLSDRSTELELEAIRPLIHHNMPLAVLTETGLVGLALFVALLLLWMAHAWRLLRDQAAPDWLRLHSLFFLAALVIYLAQAVFHEVSYMNMIHMLLYFLAGVSTGLYARAMAAKAIGARNTRAVGVAARHRATLHPTRG